MFKLPEYVPNILFFGGGVDNQDPGVVVEPVDGMIVIPTGHETGICAPFGLDVVLPDTMETTPFWFTKVQSAPEAPPPTRYSLTLDSVGPFTSDTKDRISYVDL